MGRPLSNLKAGRHAWLLLVLAWYAVACGQENLLPNGGFESGNSGHPDGWSALWAREPGKASCSLDQTVFHGGRQSLKVEHSGQEDWSLGAGPSLAVKPGDLFRLEGWARFAGGGSASVGVVAFDAGNHALNWFYAAGQAPRAPPNGDACRSPSPQARQWPPCSRGSRGRAKGRPGGTTYLWSARETPWWATRPLRNRMLRSHPGLSP